MPKKGSALGVARARFVEGLPRKAKELKAAMALLVATPDAERPREEMRRRMHALYASAQVFRLDPLASALKEGIERLDAARNENRALDQDDLDALTHLGATLPGLAGEDAITDSSPSIAAPPPGALRRSSAPPRPDSSPSSIPQPKRRKRTMIGMASAPPPSASEPPASEPPASEPPASAPPALPADVVGPAASEPAPAPKKAKPRTMVGLGTPAPPADLMASLDAPDAEPSVSKSRTAPFGSAGTKPKKKHGTMIGMAAAPASSPSENSVRAPSAAPSDDLRPSTPSSGVALGRVQLQKVPADQARPSSPPAPGGTFTAARHGHSSRPPGDIFRTVVSVLVVDRAAAQARIRKALSPDRFEIVAAADPEEALRLSRSVAPDLVLIDREVAERSGAELIARLRSDPLTDLVPIALLYDGDAALDADELREMGADAQICRDGLEEKLQPRLEGLTAVAGAVPSAGSFGEVTLEQVAERLAQELHRGLVDAAVEGRRMRIPVGEGSDLLAAAWATIAKVRAELAEASSGQVRFRDAGGRGGPAFVSLVAEGAREAAADELDPVPLKDVRIIVADDDPAVVWFFAGLFREEGAVVVEVEDGVEALEAARTKRPDLIVSDILMPRMDGLMLCRHLERDPALAEVPVILISWKEDFLQRMRELRAGASGYLRKEAASAQILQRVREVLRPRLRLENELDGTDEVRGRVEGIGIIPLLRAVGRLRHDARVTVRDAWNLYEIDIRGGALQDVTRTATDGSFARGRRALTQLLGVTAGRFTTASSDSAVRASLPPGDSDEVLADAAAELGALVDAVSGKRLPQVASLRFDEDVAAAFARTSPPAQRAVADALMDGAKPRDLLVSGEYEPHVVEEALLDLARRGAVLAVTGGDGEDLVAVARKERGARSAEVSLDVPASALVHPDSVPPPDDDGDDEAQRLSLLDAPTNAPPSLEGDATRDSAGVAAPEPKWDANPPKTELEEVLPTADSQILEVADVKPPPKPPKRAAKKAAKADEPSDAPTTVRDAPAKGSPLDDAPTTVQGAPAARAKDSGDAGLDDAPTTVRDAPAKDGLDDAPTSVIVAPGTDGLDDAPTTVQDAPAKDGLDDSPTSVIVAPAAAKKAPSLAEPAAEPEGGGMGAVAWLFVIALCGVVGYFGFNLWKSSQVVDEPVEPAELPVAEPEEPTTPAAPVAPEEPEEPASAAEAAGLGFGETVDEVMEVGVPVAEGEGLLVVEAADSGETVEVLLRDGNDERALGEAPVRVALPEGRHRLVFRRGEREQFRYLFVGAGQSRVVDPDTM
ncbi:MAG: hypothetical protein CMN30_27970 [Sandaracinus sp.]|nr:hypothetical protein [Sandaracinus sp.]